MVNAQEKCLSRCLEAAADMWMSAVGILSMDCVIAVVRESQKRKLRAVTGVTGDPKPGMEAPDIW
jgi:hypothetical protein